MEEIVYTAEQTAKIEVIRARWNGNIEVLYQEKDGTILLVTFYSSESAAAWRAANQQRDWETCRQHAGMTIGVLPDGSSHS